ncbi:MAG: phosphoglycerate kinase, partial [Planctomycetota bacterium]
MSKKNIGAVEVSGKRVFVRVDFNVPIENGTITDDKRIRAALPTIKNIIDRGGRAVLASHLGRPEGTGYEAEFSLAPAAKRLGELLGKPVGFPSQDCIDAASDAAVAAMKNGDVVLLENVRFHKAEKKGDAAFAAKLAHGADVYCNDAFGTCHRPEASMVAVPKSLGAKPKVVGFLVEKEIKFLSGAVTNPAKPFVVVLGGAKVSDKMACIDALLPKATHILIGGAMAYTFLKALGKNVGKSRVEEDRLGDAKKTLELAAKLKCELHLPTDHICSTEFNEKAGDIEVFDETIKSGFMGLDIGPRTQAKYGFLISQAKTVVWNGPMGVFEMKPFAVGTKEIARAMVAATKTGTTTIGGGGDSAAAVDQMGLA